MKRVLQDQRGIALAIAIYTLVIVGALVAGAFFAGTQEQRVGQNSKRVQQSFGVAEAGLGERLATWAPDSINLVPAYPADPVPVNMTRAPSGTGSYGGWIYKLNDQLFLIDVTGSDLATRAGQTQGGSGARQRIGLITRLAPIDFDIQASFTTQGDVNLHGNAQVNGNDLNPTGWDDCGPTGEPKAGVRTDRGSVDSVGNGTVKGVPPVEIDTSLADSSFTNFHGVSYASLAARATITLPGGNYRTEPSFVGGKCNQADMQNWGDGMNPNSSCGRRFPIVHLTGSSRLEGVQGQGILLVDGDLEIRGSYEWYGITIIQGDLRTAGGGSTEAHFWGGVLAKNADLSDQDLTGKATLNYSGCGIKKALQATSTPTMMRSRGWVQLY